MELTEKQKEVIQEAIQLEKEYGKGNVFLRHINDYWGVCFIIHTCPDNMYKPLFTKRVNRNIVNDLEKKNLLTRCDNYHNQDINPNDWSRWPGGRYCVGSRIKTELIE